jgi:hypothetical protein
MKYFNMLLDAIGFAFFLGSMFVLLHILGIYMGVV